MNINNYRQYISAETMMGPNSIRVLGELLEKHPLHLTSNDLVLDLGCGKGLTSLVMAKETGARIYANDLWISAEENERRFIQWGVDKKVTAVCEDTNHLPFEEKQFATLVSVDAYHYFAGHKGFFEKKILPLMKDGGVVLIGVPSLQDKYDGRACQLLSAWLGDDAYMFKSPKLWRELISNNDRIESVETWEMDCFNKAWNDWLSANNKFAEGDKRYFNTIIKPYTCFVGIKIKLK